MSLKSFFREKAEIKNEITTITNYETIDNASINSLWDNGVWSLKYRPDDTLGRNYQERTIRGTGTVQYMNEVKDQMLASFGVGNG
jgi:hypothetical protein